MDTNLRRRLAACSTAALVAVLIGGSPAGAAATSADQQCRRTLVSYPTITAGDREEGVATLQCLLNDAGLGPVVVDGYYGPQTQRAVWRIARNFEADPADPYEITPGFWSLLNGGRLPDRDLSEGDHGRAVFLLQRALRALGYPIAVDGTFGPQTRGFLEAYQRGYGHRPVGVVDSDTRFLLSCGGYC